MKGNDPVRGLAIEAVGAFGGAGTSATRAFGAMRLGLKLFEELPSLDADGQPLIGARTPIDLAAYDGVARMVAMAVLALRECAGEHANTAAPLLLCLPEPVDGAFAPEGVLSLVAHESSVAVERASSRVFPTGRLGALAALLEAERLLSSRAANMVYVGGVDSLVDREALDRALRAGRIKTSTSDGIIPGEGAAFLRLSLDAGRALATVAGLATGTEPAPSEPGAASTGEGLTSAARAALADAGLDMAQLGAVFHDGAGDRFVVSGGGHRAAAPGAARPARPGGLGHRRIGGRSRRGLHAVRAGRRRDVPAAGCLHRTGRADPGQRRRPGARRRRRHATRRGAGPSGAQPQVGLADFQRAALPAAERAGVGGRQLRDVSWDVDGARDQRHARAGRLENHRVHRPLPLMDAASLDHRQRERKLGQRKPFRPAGREVDQPHLRSRAVLGQLLIGRGRVQEARVEVARQQRVAIALPGRVVGSGEIAARPPVRRQRAEPHRRRALGGIHHRVMRVLEVGRRLPLQVAGLAPDPAPDRVSPLDDVGVLGVGAPEAALPG